MAACVSLSCSMCVCMCACMCSLSPYIKSITTDKDKDALKSIKLALTGPTKLEAEDTPLADRIAKR